MDTGSGFTLAYGGTGLELDEAVPDPTTDAVPGAEKLGLALFARSRRSLRRLSLDGMLFSDR